MLKLIHVTKKFGELVAVNDLSFAVETGQIFGIAGPNGAGKSTVYNLITGFYPFEGRIEFEGRNIKGRQPHQIAKLGIARTFQIPQTFPSLTVEQSVGVGNRFGALPYTLVVEPDGRILVRHAGGMKREQIEPLLERLTAHN